MLTHVAGWIARTVLFTMSAALVAGAGAQGALVSHWALDDGAPSQTAADSAGPNPLTLGTTAGVDAADPTWTTSSKVGPHALEFDGSQIALAPSSASLSVTNITLSAWVRRIDPLSRGREIFLGKGNGGGAGDTSYWFEFRADDRLSFYLHVGSDRALASPGAFTGTDWHHLVGTYDGATQRLYVDGLQVNSTNFSGSISTNSHPFGIGQMGSLAGLRLEGFLDDIALWDQALTGPEVAGMFNLAQHADLGYNASQANLLFELHNAGVGTTMIDELIWQPATGLTGALGAVEQVGDNFFLRLDVSGTGVQGAPPIIPEPGTLVLAAVGLAGIAPLARRRRRLA